jgi:hypothetical protein
VHDEIEPVDKFSDLCGKGSRPGGDAHIHSDRMRDGAARGDFGAGSRGGCVISLVGHKDWKARPGEALGDRKPDALWCRR